MLRPAAIVSTSLALAAVLAAAPARSSTERGPLAFIAGISGRVDVSRSASKSPERGTLGLALLRGDKVQVGSGGSATLLFNDGNLLSLSEKSAITVGGAGKNAGAEPNAVMAGVFKSVSEGVVGGSRETGLVALAPVRGGSVRTEMVLAPRQTDVLDDRPTFLWRRQAGATRYRLTIAGEDGELWRNETSDTTLVYPADAPALPRGADLTWKLDAADDRGPLHAEENGFRIKPAEDGEAIRARLEQIEQHAGGAAAFLAGAYLGGNGLYSDAIARFETLCREQPGQPGPHEALGRLYRAVGLMDLAAGELQTALNLSRQP